MRHTGIQKYTLVLIVTLLGYCHLSAQSPKHKISFKDSLDGKFDLSDYVIYANGFIPIPLVITEPALGGFGLAMIPIFLKSSGQNFVAISLPLISPKMISYL